MHSFTHTHTSILFSQIYLNSINYQITDRKVKVFGILKQAHTKQQKTGKNYTSFHSFFFSHTQTSTSIGGGDDLSKMALKCVIQSFSFFLFLLLFLLLRLFSTSVASFYFHQFWCWSEQATDQRPMLIANLAADKQFALSFFLSIFAPFPPPSFYSYLYSFLLFSPPNEPFSRVGNKVLVLFAVCCFFTAFSKKLKKEQTRR